MKKVVVTIAIILVVLLITTEVMLPRYFAQQVEESLYRQVAGVDSIKVKIDSRPSLLLLTGRIQNSSLLAKGVKIEGVRIDKLEAWYEDLHYVKTPQGSTTTGGTNVYFRADILEDDLNQYLKATLPQFDTLQVEASDNKMTVYVKMGRWVDLKISGTLDVTADYKIRFIPTDLDQSNLSSMIVSQVVSVLEFDLGLKNAPLPLDLKEIQIMDGKIQALGGSQI